MTTQVGSHLVLEIAGTMTFRIRKGKISDLQTQNMFLVHSSQTGLDLIKHFGSQHDPLFNCFHSQGMNDMPVSYTLEAR